MHVEFQMLDLTKTLMMTSECTALQLDVANDENSDDVLRVPRAVHCTGNAVPCRAVQSGCCRLCQVRILMMMMMMKSWPQGLVCTLPNPHCNETIHVHFFTI